MSRFSEKHPKAARWIREGGLFLLFSYVVTFIKWGMLTFLPAFFQKLVGNVGWSWPAIRVNWFGVPMTLSIIGNTLEDGGLAFTLANFTNIILGECINFPLQRNLTFRSKGPLLLQLFLHFAGTLSVFFIMNLFTCIWNPLSTAFHLSDAVRNIVTTFVTGTFSLVIIFSIDKTIFSPGFGEEKPGKSGEGCG